MAGAGAAQAVAATLKVLGVNILQQWLRECIAHLEGRGGPRPVNEDSLTLQVYTMVLNTDLRRCAACILPLGIDQMQDQHLPGPYVVQVLESKNIGEALETRNKESAKRCIRLALTDGQQTVVGWEYRPRLRGLEFCPPVGLKLVLRNVWVRNGHFMLLNETTTVLGGSVGQVDGDAAARLIENRGAQGEGEGAHHPLPPLPRPAPPLPPPPPPPQQPLNSSRFDDDDNFWASIPLPCEDAMQVDPPPAHPPDPSSSSSPARPPSSSSATVSPLHPRQPEIITIDDDSPPSDAPPSPIALAPSHPTTGQRGGFKAEDPFGLGQPPSPLAPHPSSGTGRLKAEDPSSGSSAPRPQPPFSCLADLRRHVGEVMVIKAVAVGVDKAKMTKKGLRIAILLDDGSGVTVTARLSDEVLTDLLGISPADFRALRESDPVAAQQRLSAVQQRISSFEGVMELRLPLLSPGGSEGVEDKQGSSGVPVVLSRRDPNDEDLRKMKAYCESLPSLPLP